MHKNRLEAFSDGVLAIIITIMVLELKTPVGEGFNDFKELFSHLLSYLLSFTFLGIYWNNHHHLLHTVHRVNGNILWANLHLLFWLSLTPLTTAWMGEHHHAEFPVAIYGINLLLDAVAYYILQVVIVNSHGNESTLSRALGNDLKGKISLVLYSVSIATAFFIPWVSLAIFIIVALIWLIPDKRIERMFDGQ